MKIAIDCHTLEIKNWAGKEQALFNILESLFKLDKNNDYILYFKKSVKLDFIKSDKWKIKKINICTPFWHLVVIFDMLFRKADILFSPCSYLLPVINVFVSNVVLLHDLSTFIPGISDTHKKSIIWKERLTLKLAMKRSKKIISISENTKNDCIKYLNISPDKIQVVYVGNKRNLYKINDEKIISDALAKYDLPKRFFLFVGTLEPRKNISNIIRAFGGYLLENPHIDIPLLLVGKKGWYFKDFFQLVKDLELEQRVVFTGYLPDEVLPYLYNRAEIVIYPSLYEGFGSPVLEVMSCGAPVITSNISSLPEVAGDAAVLVNPNNINEIKLAITKIMSDKLFRDNLIKKGIIQAQKFSWDIFTKELLDIFNSINKK